MTVAALPASPPRRPNTRTRRGQKECVRRNLTPSTYGACAGRVSRACLVLLQSLFLELEPDAQATAIAPTSQKEVSQNRRAFLPRSRCSTVLHASALSQ